MGNVRSQDLTLIMIPSRAFHRLAPLVRHLSVALVKPGYHLSHCPNFRSLLYLPPEVAVQGSRNKNEGRILNRA